VLRAAAVRTVVLVALGVLAVGAMVAGGLLWMTALKRVTVPNLVELTPAEASRVLAAAHLDDGRADYRVTHDLPSGVVVTQSPAPFARAARFSTVDVTIAAAPKTVVIPDVVLGDAESAEKYMRGLLFTPLLLHAYANVVPAGRVVEQLPRAGDSAVTGGAVVLVVSLGPGLGGKVVPPVVGMRVSEARSRLAAARLSVGERPVVAGSARSETVMDQAPAAGSRVAVGSVVALSVAMSQR
jgi:eukaryotic-like serine/threonine-protein kinase